MQKFYFCYKKQSVEMKERLIAIVVIILCVEININAQNRWKIDSDGEIVWEIKEGESHFDHIEMSGFRVSTVLRYGILENGSLSVTRGMVFPLLRTIPNNTHASLMRRVGDDYIPFIHVNGNRLTNEKCEKIKINGLVEVVSKFSMNKGGDAQSDDFLQLQRTFFPSVSLPVFCEEYILTNKTGKVLRIEIPEAGAITRTDSAKGVDGVYIIESKLLGQGNYDLEPNGELVFGSYIAGYKENDKLYQIDIQKEKQLRKDLISELQEKLILETPDQVLNTLFAFAKIRGSESIYSTKGGLMHGPGGESYYAAIWANDQAEYINPFFPFLGYEVGNESALNSFRHFSRFMNDGYAPIPSSIIAEGTDIWNGAGDRGDAAMIAYGAARYALEMGNKNIATELWPLIEWCLEYCKRKTNEYGVVESDTDELEGRFPSGDANLCTSSLYYDALVSAVYLGKELEKPKKQLNQYQNEAKNLLVSIENYFGHNVEGFDTYQYYKGNDILRSWICIPLTMGIFDRKDETVKALFSPQLWTENGLLTQAGDVTFWDRSTLYALRGVLSAGETKNVMPFLKQYSSKRLLGDHVPYPIEAFPEGSQRHLSAESGLYCRIFIEGLFGIRPTGFKSFVLRPVMPSEWNKMSLKKIKAFDSDFDIEITKKSNKLLIVIKSDNKIVLEKTIAEGEQIQVNL